MLWKPDEGAVSVIVEIAELCNFNDCLYGICEDRAWYSPYSFDSIVKILELFDMFSYSGYYDCWSDFCNYAHLPLIFHTLCTSARNVRMPLVSVCCDFTHCTCS